ncbi:MAG: hypothetical protein KC996_11475 [Phycisphaerales bacterium]|nr:hypothetical protein [Phycisphaerales bacterium]
MRVRLIGQLLLGFAFLLIVWNVLESEFGYWTVRRWFSGWTPVDVMFVIAVGLVGLMVLGSDQTRPPGSGQPPQRTRTLW